MNFNSEDYEGEDMSDAIERILNDVKEINSQITKYCDMCGYNGPACNWVYRFSGDKALFWSADAGCVVASVEERCPRCTCPSFDIEVVDD